MSYTVCVTYMYMYVIHTVYDIHVHVTHTINLLVCDTHSIACNLHKSGNVGCFFSHSYMLILDCWSVKYIICSLRPFLSLPFLSLPFLSLPFLSLPFLSLSAKPNQSMKLMLVGLQKMGERSHDT